MGFFSNKNKKQTKNPVSNDFHTLLKTRLTSSWKWNSELAHEVNWQGFLIAIGKQIFWIRTSREEV